MSSAMNLYELPAEQPGDAWHRQRELYEQALALYEQDQATACLEVIDRLVEQFGAHDVPTIRLQLKAQARLSQPQSDFDPVISVETK
jgi:hypothetical protein